MEQYEIVCKEFPDDSTGWMPRFFVGWIDTDAENALFIASRVEKLTQRAEV